MAAKRTRGSRGLKNRKGGNSYMAKKYCNVSRHNFIWAGKQPGQKSCYLGMQTPRRYKCVLYQHLLDSVPCSHLTTACYLEYCSPFQQEARVFRAGDQDEYLRGSGDVLHPRDEGGGHSMSSECYFSLRELGSGNQKRKEVAIRPGLLHSR